MDQGRGCERVKLISAQLTCVAVAFLAVCVAAGAPAQAAAPVPFETISGTCAIDPEQGGWSSEWSSGLQQVQRDAVLARGQFSSGHGQFSLGEGIAVGGFGGSDTSWIVDTGLYRPPSEIGEPIQGFVSCLSGPSSYTISLFDPPMAPTGFAGRTTPSSDPDTASQIAFRAPAEGKYQAAVTVTSGVVTIDRNSPPISGSKTISLGLLGAYELRTIDVEAEGLSQASWSLSVSRFVDVTPPLTRITFAPSRTVGRMPRFHFRSSERVDFECRIDDGRFRPCASPYMSKRLRYGRHRFFVRATDAAGNVESPPVSHRFRIVKPR
jgi:hypothetical protein